jgi:hypothetical protein
MILNPVSTKVSILKNNHHVNIKSEGIDTADKDIRPKILNPEVLTF